MKYKVIEIEGIGPAYAEKLNAAGIIDSDDLLETGASVKGRKALAEKTGIEEVRILRWVNHSDLFRIHGVGPQFAELLEASGVDTVKELRTRNAENLAARMEQVMNEKGLTRTSPSAKVVAGWIEEAKTLEPRVSH